MSETPFENSQNSDDELLAEYQFDYQKAKPNRFSSHEINLASQGINQEEAAILRASLATFADDWNSPEMSIYDNYDANAHKK